MFKMGLTSVPLFSLAVASAQREKMFATWDVIKDISELAVTLMILFGLMLFFSRWKPHLAVSKVIARKRAKTLVFLAAFVLGIKVSEDVTSGESGPVDRAILLAVHENISEKFHRFFELVTLTGSMRYLVGIASLFSLILVLKQRRPEALFLVLCVTSGGVFTYAIKLIVNRQRPTLWETEWYWGSSFPSGHTLGTTCCAGALAFCLSRTWPPYRRVFQALAVIWVALVGISRLVLGVHWPTDVLSAGCFGLILVSFNRLCFARLTHDQVPPRTR